MNENLPRVSRKDARALYKKSKQPSNPEFLDPKLKAYADIMPEPTCDPGALDEISLHLDNGGTLMIAVGPHLTDLDQLGVGGQFYRHDLAKVALSTRTLAKAEYWYDFGEEFRNNAQEGGAIPAFRWDPVKQRFPQKLVKYTKKPLNKLVVNVATDKENPQHIMLFTSGTRYRKENDPDGHGPYERIPIKPGIEHMSNRILKAGGNLALVCVGLYAPEDNLYTPPNAHLTKPHILKPEHQQPGAITKLVHKEVHRASRETRIAAGVLAAEAAAR